MDYQNQKSSQNEIGITAESLYQRTKLQSGSRRVGIYEFDFFEDIQFFFSKNFWTQMISRIYSNPFVLVGALLWLSLQQRFSKQSLKRVLEPDTLTESESQVEDYSNALNTSMSIVYAMSLSTIRAIRESMTGSKDNSKANVLEICSGPGRFTALMAQELGFASATGVDLSPTMLASARAHSKEQGLSDKVQFVKQNALSLIEQGSSEISKQSYDVVAFMNGAHHFDSANAVTQVLSQASQVCKDEGFIILVDPVRPRNRSILNQLRRVAYALYNNKSLVAFLKDYHDSMYASFTAEEFRKLAPQDSDRQWVAIQSPLVPMSQILVGLPKGVLSLKQVVSFKVNQFESKQNFGIRLMSFLAKMDVWLSSKKSVSFRF